MEEQIQKKTTVNKTETPRSDIYEIVTEKSYVSEGTVERDGEAFKFNDIYLYSWEEKLDDILGKEGYTITFDIYSEGGKKTLNIPYVSYVLKLSDSTISITDPVLISQINELGEIKIFYTILSTHVAVVKEEGRMGVKLKFVNDLQILGNKDVFTVMKDTPFSGEGGIFNIEYKNKKRLLRMRLVHEISNNLFKPTVEPADILSSFVTSIEELYYMSTESESEDPIKKLNSMLKKIEAVYSTIYKNLDSLRSIFQKYADLISGHGDIFKPIRMDPLKFQKYQRIVDNTSDGLPIPLILKYSNKNSNPPGTPAENVPMILVKPEYCLEACFKDSTLKFLLSYCIAEWAHEIEVDDETVQNLDQCFTELYYFLKPGEKPGESILTKELKDMKRSVKGLNYQTQKNGYIFEKLSSIFTGKSAETTYSSFLDTFNNIFLLGKSKDPLSRVATFSSTAIHHIQTPLKNIEDLTGILKENGNKFLVGDTTKIVNSIGEGPIKNLASVTETVTRMYMKIIESYTSESGTKLNMWKDFSGDKVGSYIRMAMGLALSPSEKFSGKEGKLFFGEGGTNHIYGAFVCGSKTADWPTYKQTSFLLTPIYVITLVWYMFRCAYSIKENNDEKCPADHPVYCPRYMYITDVKLPNTKEQTPAQKKIIGGIKGFKTRKETPSSYCAPDVTKCYDHGYKEYKECTDEEQGGESCNLLDTRSHLGEQYDKMLTIVADDAADDSTDDSADDSSHIYFHI